MAEQKYTIRIEVPELGIEQEFDLELVYTRSDAVPGSNLEPYEPEIPAETYINSAEVQGHDVSFLLGDIEVLEDRLHQED